MPAYAALVLTDPVDPCICVVVRCSIDVGTRCETAHSLVIMTTLSSVGDRGPTPEETGKSDPIPLIVAHSW